MNVALNIEHTWDEDLGVFLVAPSGTRVELFTRIGGAAGNNFTNTILDDEAATHIALGVPPFTGTYRPEGSLASFDGELARGTWTLEVTDYVPVVDHGTLLDWTLQFCSVGAPDFDDDLDGCTTYRELGDNPIQGGVRNPVNFWDFFDTPGPGNVRDRAITAGDLSRAVRRFGTSGVKTTDPRSMPPPEPAYHPAFDRTPPGEAPNGEDQGPNGSVTAQDIAVIVSQFGHTCA